MGSQVDLIAATEIARSGPGTQQASTSRLRPGEGGPPDASGTPTLALTLDLTPLVQPTLATRATQSVNFVREPWWPHDLTDALADLWLRRLAEQAYAATPDHRSRRTQHRSDRR